MVTCSAGIYQSSLLSRVSGVVHGFSTRQLGDARVAANAEAIAGQIGGRSMTIVGVKQVHGNTVLPADGRTPRIAGDADGIVSVAPRVLLEIHVADCVPVLLADPDTGVVAAVHAGWRGTLGGIVGNAVRAMTLKGANAAHICAVIGPHIGTCCYAVSQERATLFPGVSSFWEGAWHVDLGKSVYDQLIAAHVEPSRIDRLISCTACQTDRFFSYRKDQKATFGEIVGMIGHI